MRLRDEYLHDMRQGNYALGAKVENREVGQVETSPTARVGLAENTRKRCRLLDAGNEHKLDSIFCI